MKAKELLQLFLIMALGTGMFFGIGKGASYYKAHKKTAQAVAKTNEAEKNSYKKTVTENVTEKSVSTSEKLIIKGQNKNPITKKTFLGYGSAEYLAGRVLVVSVFLDTPSFQWDARELSEGVRLKYLEKVKAGTEFIRSECGRYGREVTFVYDWNQNHDLLYKGYCNAEEYESKKNLLNQLVDEQALKNKYGAENIVYLCFVNNDDDNAKRSYCTTHVPGGGPLKEIAVIYRKTPVLGGKPRETTWVVVSHEILHAFGAPDLYEANKLITQEYVDYLKREKINDIMSVGNEKSQISPTTAYYLGLIDRASDVERFNLGPAEK